MLKRIALAVVVIIVAVAVFTFTARNTGTVQLDLAYDVIELSVPVAVISVFAIGWLFGVITMGLYALKLVNERRGLKRTLRNTETEVSSLRNLPLSDAD